MHNLHYVAITADSAKEAAEEVKSAIGDWGDENNWRLIGGVASASGNDDLECYDTRARWVCDPAVLKDTPFKTIFEVCIHNIKSEYDKYKIGCDWEHLVFDTFTQARDFIIKEIMEVKTEGKSPTILCHIKGHIDKLQEILNAKRHNKDKDIPVFFEWQLDQFGLTDLREDEDRKDTYIVFVDMHS